MLTLHDISNLILTQLLIYTLLARTRIISILYFTVCFRNHGNHSISIGGGYI